MMRRSIVGFLTFVGLFAILIAGRGPLTSAQDAAGSDFGDHPLVGTWNMVIDGDSGCANEAVFTSSGGYIDVSSCDGSVVVGVWEPTGESTANLTIYQADEEGTWLIRAAVTVADDGQTFAAEYTFEMFDPEATEGSGEYGPGTVAGTLRVAEGPGEPVGSLEDAWGDGEGGSEEATPSS